MKPFLPLILLISQLASAQEAPLATITIVPGTRILTVLQSPLHTTSATAGSGVYLETAYPVIQDNRVVIPAHTQILGTVEDDRRPGRTHGRAQFRIRLTSLILPNNYVVPMDGTVQSLPGSRTIRTRGERGAFAPVDQIDRDVYTIAGGAATGAGLGYLARGAIGPGGAALIGAGAGLIKVLFTRGDAIALPHGASLEVILERSITLPQDKIAAVPETARAAGSPVLKQAAEAEPDTPKLQTRKPLRTVRGSWPPWIQ
jgi:hypothetical protein